MDVKTFRARSMQAALQMVRDQLGPDASVLHTRVVGNNLLNWMTGGKRVEVTASSQVKVASRFTEPAPPARPETYTPPKPQPTPAAPVNRIPRSSRVDSPAYDDSRPAHELDFRAQFRAGLSEGNGQSFVEELCNSPQAKKRELPETLFKVFTDLIDQDIHDEQARDLIERVRTNANGEDLDDPLVVKTRIARLIQDDIQIAGPIAVTPGQTKLVALIGPTGVGKTTTIAKLAANYRLRDKMRVGLITVDTYRIAAVEQLRTYADIIDLPMEVVSTPKEMRQAVDRLSGLDLILLDTAGRSPKDDIQIQELKSLLNEAKPDEVHLVLSSVTSTSALRKASERFTEIGANALVLTKLDEATGLGNLLPLLKTSRLPISYLTNGQNVPNDIAAADNRKLARVVLGMDSGDK